MFLTVAKVGKKLSLYAGDDEAKPVQANCWMIECFYRAPLTPHQSEKGVKTEQNITNKKRRNISDRLCTVAKSHLKSTDKKFAKKKCADNA